MSRTTDQYGISMLLHERILDAQRQINKNMSECLFGDTKPKHIPTFGEKVTAFFMETKNRISNAYDCLVKGVDPYDGY